MHNRLFDPSEIEHAKGKFGINRINNSFSFVKNSTEIVIPITVFLVLRNKVKTATGNINNCKLSDEFRFSLEDSIFKFNNNTSEIIFNTEESRVFLTYLVASKK